MLTTQSTKGAEAGSDGYAVLLLHAFPLSAVMWNQQLRALEEAGIAAVAPNAYGIEGSDEMPDWTFDGYARDLCAMLDDIGCRKASIVGLSMGGYQAFAFYRLFPERTASLVLCDTRAEADAPESAKQRQEFIEAVENGGPAEAIKRMMPNYFTPETRNANPSLVEHTAAMITEQSVIAITSAMKAIMKRDDATPLLSDIACPVLVLNGREDRLTTAQTAEYIAKAIPGAELELIQDAGHLSNMEQPDRFNRALLGHINRVRSL
ncbi:MAG: alpha/beta fold hydrolase [Chlorobium limicola]|uniref:alpha/beta fold hydrolase n=1 Tax=Chlorobium limicola TaxID=1092 RepID=UPI0023F135B4|nr:alpha/beta fold hydrolase [Chlorobium limicola]NTV21215.1 alpha/beta fold hydrolase [Chlorobium limicola]